MDNTLKSRLSQLQNSNLPAGVEEGIILRENDNYGTTSSVFTYEDIVGDDFSIDPRKSVSAGVKIAGVIHNHPEEGGLSCFSASDVAMVKVLYDRGNIKDIKKFTMIMTSKKDGSTYNLVVTNNYQFNTFWNSKIGTPWNEGVDEMLDSAEANGEALEMFMEIFKDSGIAVFKSNPNSYSNYNKVVLNSDNEIQFFNCPQ